MRRFYALLAGLVLTLFANQSNALPVTPDVANFTAHVFDSSRVVEFINTSTIGSEPGDRKALWTFGDGTHLLGRPLANVVHQYAVPGTYNVCLSIYRYRAPGDSVLSAVICKTVTITRLCTANFEKLSPTTANPLLTFFKAFPWSNAFPHPIRICWTFGDGRDTCINYPANYTGQYLVAHTYNHPGTYQVCVTITYDGNCVASKCKAIVVGNPDQCAAEFEKIPTAANPLNVYYKALPSHSNNRKPSRVCWIFGDGSDTCINYPETYTGLYAVSHQYAHAGDYQVCVNIRYYGGCEASKCHPIRVGTPDSCGADFERILTSSSVRTVLFNAIPSHSNNRKPSRVCWRFGDGSDTCINYPESYTGLYSVLHHYAQPGNYNVCVRINYYGGCEADKCRNVTIPGPDSCGANFERVPGPNSMPHVTWFRALPYHNNNKRPARICWQFGDGSDTCINYPASYTGNYLVSHRYAQPGNYNVCVRIRYYGDCEAQHCRVIAVPPPQPGCAVNMEVINSSNNGLIRGFVVRPYSFATPPAPPVQICWRFGDGRDTCINIDSTMPPQPAYTMTHHYPGPGVYNACVRVVFRGGCVAETCRQVVIGPQGPRLVLAPNPAHYYLNVEFHSIRTEQVMIRIVSHMGIPVRNYTRNVVIGVNNWTDNISNLVPGIYTFVVQSPYQFVSANFIKQ